MRRPLPSVLFAAMALGALTFAAWGPTAHAAARDGIHGGWIGEAPCAFTSVAPSPTPNTLSFSCVSGTTWNGDLTGHTHYVVTGTTDLSTSQSKGSIDETFIGVDTATATSGTIHLLGSLTIDGNTNTIVIDEEIVGGTGAFADTRGTLEFEGFQASGVAGEGGYHGIRR